MDTMCFTSINFIWTLHSTGYSMFGSNLYIVHFDIILPLDVEHFETMVRISDQLNMKIVCFGQAIHIVL